jgi:hypothetical protein
MHVYCFGYGTCAHAVRQQAASQDWQFSGTGTTEASFSDMAKENVRGYVFNGEEPMENIANRLAGVTHVLISVPPDGDGDLVLRHHWQDLLVAPDLKWVGYFSTTGVYGDRGGAEVDENTSVEPVSVRGKRRVQAELDWLKFAKEAGVKLVRFRLPGLYGPERNPLKRIQQGIPHRIHKPGHLFSRIHTDDVGRAVIAAIEKPDTEGCFNLCDDEPAPQSDVIAYGCELLSLEVPPLKNYGAANLSPMARSFYEESRYVKNDLIKKTFDFELAYPTYREGLAALLKDL